MTEATPTPAESSQPVAAKRSKLHWSWRTLIASVSLMLACVVLLVLAVSTEIGARFGLSLASVFRIQAVHVEGWKGRLWDHWQAERLELSFATTHVRITHLDVAWHLPSVFGRSIRFDRLHADALEVRTAKSDKPDEPKHVPESLRLPMAIAVTDLHIGRLEIGEWLKDLKASAPPPAVVLRDISGHISSDADLHRVDQLAVMTPAGRVTGSARIAVTPPFALSAKLQLISKIETRTLTLDASAEGGLAAPHVHLRASGDGIAGEADLLAQPFEAVPLQRAQVAFKHVDPAAFNADAPHADMDVRADLTPGAVAATKGKTLAPSDWRISGPVEIVNHAAAPIDAKGIPVERVFAQLNWSAGQLKADALRVELPRRGLLAGPVSWTPGGQAGQAEKTIGRIEGQLKLTAVDPSLIYSTARPARINGEVSATARATDQQFKLNLAADRYTLNATGEQHDGVLTLTRAELRTGPRNNAASMIAQGQIALRGERRFALHGSLSRGDPQLFVATAPRGDLNATFDVGGQLAPTWQAKMSLKIGDSKLASYPLTGGGHLSLVPGRVFDADVNLNVLDNHLVVAGAFGLPGDHLHYRVDAAHIDRLIDGASGHVSAEGTLSGSMELPSGDMTAHTDHLSIGNMHIDSADAQAHLQDGLNGLFNAKVDVATVRAGAADSSAVVRSAGMVISGKRNLHDVTAFADLFKDQRIDLRASGGLSGAGWRGQLQTLTAQGPVVFRLLQPVAMEASPQHVSLAPTQLQAQNGKVQIARLEWTPQSIVTKGSITGVQVGFSLDENQAVVMRGNSLQLGGEWDIELADKPRGLVRVFREGGDLILQGDAPVAMGLETFETTLGVQDDRLTLSALANGSRIGAINLVVSAATQGRGTSIRLNQDAQLVGVGSIQIPSIAWVGPFLNQNLRTAGTVHGEFNILGTPADPHSAGRIQGDQLELALADQGLRLSDGSLVVSFDAARATLEKLDFKSDNKMPPPDSRLAFTNLRSTPGKLTANGELQLATGQGDFHVQAERVAALQQANQWMLVSGSADIQSGWDHFDLNAKLKADTGFIGVQKGGAPRLTDDVVVRGRKPKPPPGMRLNANIDFDFGDRFILKAYGIDTYLDGLLRLRIADGGDMRATGAIRARNGVFEAYGQRLTIERGAVTFQGPIDNPAVNVVALRKNLPVEAGVEVTGTARSPRVQLVSEPNVPESEKLSWILLGRATEVGSNDAGLLLSAASAALGGTGEGLVDRIARGIGLDDINVGQSSDSTGTLQSRVTSSATGVGSSASASSTSAQVLTLGKRISARAYLAVEQNLVGTESIVKLSYTLTRFLSLVARAGTDNALDLNYSVSFR